MKKYCYIITMVIGIGLVACMEDTSAYLPQEKEQVIVDQDGDESIPGENDDDEILPEGILVPGTHLVKLNIKAASDETVERCFKYFMPISINATRPISLIFEFHGNIPFGKDTKPVNPIERVNSSHLLAQLAIKENCIICFPAGTPEYQKDSSGSVGWQVPDKHYLFVDSMLQYFNSRTPSIDINRIYSTGQSSGAIFSFELAFHRSTIFAAITPRAGQKRIVDPVVLPSRAVPIRVFAGETDGTVNHEAVVDNMTTWAERIGGYFASDMVLTPNSIEIPNYKKVDTRIWSGGYADLQIYTLKEEGHNISLNYCIPYMWEFMVTHPLNQTGVNNFVTSEIKEFTAMCGQTISFNINYAEDATAVLKKAPSGWTTKLENKKVTLIAPKDFYANIDRDGELIIEVIKGSNVVSTKVVYSLLVPKAYFEIGDIYYNDKFEPAGVVCWVNTNNIREAKIISLKGPGNKESMYYCGKATGLGMKFDTPDQDDGYANTVAMTEHNATIKPPYTSSNAAFMWAWEYDVEDKGWYLPAINELAALLPHKKKIEEVLLSVEGSALKTRSFFSSTTEIKKGARNKTVYYYDFLAEQIKGQTSAKPGLEAFGFIYVRAFKKITK